MRTVEQATRDHVRGLDAQQSPVGWDEIITRGEAKTVVAPIRRPARARGYLVFAAALVVVMLLGVFPVILRSSEEPPPATEPVPTPTTGVTPTTVEVTPTTLAESVELEFSSVLSALVESGLYGVRFTDQEIESYGGSPLTRSNWDGWTTYPRVDALFANLVMAPQTRLPARTQLWLARFEDEATATAFIADYFDPDQEAIREEIDRGGWPVPSEFVVELIPVDFEADDSFGWMWDGPVVGVRQGSVVALAGIPREAESPTSDKSLRPLEGYVDEARYLGAWLAAALIGEQPTAPAPLTEPFTDEENEAISLIHEFHDALSAADYDTALSINWPRLENPPDEPSEKEALINDIEPLLEAGAVFEASRCRPTRTDRGVSWEGGSDRWIPENPGENAISGLLELECYSGYQSDNGSDFDYHTFLYKNGSLILLNLPYEG